MIRSHRMDLMMSDDDLAALAKMQPVLRVAPQPRDLNNNGGRTSVAIRLDVIASRNLGEERVPVTSGLFTFVALDENHHPRLIPEESKQKYRKD